ncbi:MAG: prolipoprotein diacylglyceryl transferase [Burkholderiales bacterium]
MWVHPQFDPVALRLGPVSIHWYGLMYLVAFALFFFLMRRRVASPVHAADGWTARDIDDILFFGVMGVIIGGRLGQVVFYEPLKYLANPLEIFMVWKGGMAFHGGMLGVIVALALFARLRGRSFWQVMDIVAPCVPTGLLMGRIGNFINGELWGRVAPADMPWAMAFPQAGDLLPRHPSQIYQALTEGLVLFVFLWWYASKPRLRGQVSGMFLIGYGSLRFVTEYFRQPDHFDLGPRWLAQSQGQTLCLLMVLAGIAILAWSRSQQGAKS